MYTIISEIHSQRAYPYTIGLINYSYIIYQREEKNTINSKYLNYHRFENHIHYIVPIPKYFKMLFLPIISPSLFIGILLSIFVRLKQ